jgi:hypothetical protein
MAAFPFSYPFRFKPVFQKTGLKRKFYLESISFLVTVPAAEVNRR